MSRLREYDSEIIECVACGYEIKESQQAGGAICGHGNIHYNCSYLSVKCEICNRTLIIDINQPINYLQMESESGFSTNSQNGSAPLNRSIETDIVDLKLLIMELQSKVTNEIKKLNEGIIDTNRNVLKLTNELLELKMEIMQMQMKALKTADKEK